MAEKIYVAASFEQAHSVKKAYEVLRNAGHEIAYDWTDHRATANIESDEEREALRRQYAQEDVAGVENATVYILLLGDRASTGAHIELGIALGARKRIFIVTKNPTDQLFYRHPRVEIVPSLQAVIKRLKS
jgi:NADH dehydrogenase/NADH:ubiquinone oxidoreductase subunit G